jgi:hypothetical protein
LTRYRPSNDLLCIEDEVHFITGNIFSTVIPEDAVPRHVGLFLLLIP